MGKLAELEKKKAREGLTSEEEKLYNFLKEQKTERQKILTPADKNPFNVSIGGFLGGGKEPEQKSTQDESKKSTTSTGSTGFTCPKCGEKGFSSWQEVINHQNAGGCAAHTKTMGAKDKLKSYFDTKGLTGENKIFSWKGIKSRGADTLTKGLDKYGGSAVSQVKNNLKFAIYFPLAVLSVFRLLIPTVEGYTGTAITPAFIEPFLLWETLPVILAALFGVALPPSIILGKSGVSFDILNKICLFSIAGSATVWGGNNVLVPAVKAFMPEEYALMMCMMKYKGNMQICVAQNQTVQYQKTGSYETLKMELGAVTPSQTIPPPNPVPDTWDIEPYEFTFTLSNKNVVGSVYDITVNNVNVSASPFEDNRDVIYASEDNIINMPNYPIKPGGYVVITAKFDKSFYSLIQRNPITNLLEALVTKQLVIPNCKQYTYFRINVTTDQLGGGSAKFGLIENDEGIDNQNFMYFFNPDVKTDTGPVDIYTYTLPFVIPVNRMRDAEGSSDFGVYIKIENKGDGIVSIQNLTLAQASETQDSLKIKPNCRSSDVLGFTVKNCPAEAGKCIIIENIQPIVKKRTVTFRCDGVIEGTEPFFGKTTDLISVNGYYRYTQSFNEQIACVKDEGLIDTFCMSLNETYCKSGTAVCHWCNECNGQRVAAHSNCTAFTDCGYTCVKNSKCGAECGSNGDCPQDRPYCTQDCRCLYPII